jgi:UDP-N-acetylmuramate dehydrogenase
MTGSRPPSVLTIRRDAELRALNTFGVTARARVLVELTDAAQADALVQQLPSLGAGAPQILGGGSNLLLTRDVERTVLRVMNRGIRTTEDGRESIVEANAGEYWHDLVETTLAMGLQGLENLALIPWAPRQYRTLAPTGSSWPSASNR